MRELRAVLLLLLALCAGNGLRAQEVRKERIPFVSTNVLDWAYLGGINASAGVNLSQFVTLEAGVVYNPFSLRSEGQEFRNQQKTASLTVRYWPWYVYSGWWFGLRARYTDYSKTPMLRNTNEEGKAVGGGFSAGYALMLNKHWSLDFGLGLWGGMKLDHTAYDRGWGEKLLESGSKGFVDLDKVSISLIYLF